MATYPRFEEKFWEDICEKILPKLESFKKPPSMISVGGGQWRFGKLVMEKGKGKSLVYAGNNPKVNTLADENGVLSTLADVSNYEELKKIGKYDVALIKGTFEEMAGKVESLEEYFFTLYKLVKLRGKAFYFVRFRPTLPLPQKILDAWNSKLPDPDTFMKEAEECGFTPEGETLIYNVEVEKEDWITVLKNSQLPYLDAISKAEMEEHIKKLPPKIKFTDTFSLITLSKIISTTPS